MDLSLTEEQHALVESFTDLLAKHSSPTHVRDAEPLGYDPSLWQRLTEVGTVQMAVAESHGGWGAGVADLALVAERVGAALAPAPVFEAQCAARVLAATAHPLCTEVLDGALGGGHIVTMAVRPAVNSTATLVPAGAIAGAAVVLSGDRLLLVELDDARRQRVDNLASAPLADIDVTHGVEVGRGPEVVARFESALDEWLTLTASALAGMADVAHALTCAHARERVTWGRPIGSYQGVAHPLADSRTAIDGARLLVAHAAWALDRGHARARELAAMAFAFASETARDVTYQAVHFHGGYGFVLEHDAQLHYRRARGWPRVWGDATAAYRRVAAARYGERAA
jgi:alkylation response protein AidB-like acyl-CoA dehydrogenase